MTESVASRVPGGLHRSEATLSTNADALIADDGSLAPNDLNSDWSQTSVLGYKLQVSLTGKQRHHLRALGHPLHPIVTVGKDGLTTAVVDALDTALLDHELVKVRVGNSAHLDRQKAASQLAEQTSAEIAQIVGNIILLYRSHPDKPTIKLPTAD